MVLQLLHNFSQLHKLPYPARRNGTWKNVLDRTLVLILASELPKCIIEDWVLCFLFTSTVRPMNRFSWTQDKGCLPNANLPHFSLKKSTQKKCFCITKNVTRKCYVLGTGSFDPCVWTLGLSLFQRKIFRFSTQNLTKIPNLGEAGKWWKKGGLLGSSCTSCQYPKTTGRCFSWRWHRPSVTFLCDNLWLTKLNELLVEVGNKACLLPPGE